MGLLIARITMRSESLMTALGAIFPMISSRLKQAHSMAAAAECCPATGNPDGAFRILLDMEGLTCETTTLLNPASLIRREGEI